MPDKKVFVGLYSNGIPVHQPLNSDDKVYDGDNKEILTSTPEGVIPDEKIPLLAIKDVFIVSSESEMLNLIAQNGDEAIRSDIKSTFTLKNQPSNILENWVERPQKVHSIFGRDGSVIPQDGDYLASQIRIISNSNLPFNNVEEALETIKSNFDLHSHTKSQITDFEHTHEATSITGFSIHTHTKSQITDFEHSHSVLEILDISLHNHHKSQIIDFDHQHTKSEITDFDHTHDISEFPHVHPKSQIIDFAHQHTKSEITDFDHLHLKSQITDFAHTHEYLDINNIAYLVDDKVPIKFLPDFVLSADLSTVAISGSYADLTNKVVEVTDKDVSAQADGTNDTFNVGEVFIASSAKVYVNGSRQTRGVQFNETPATGIITFTAGSIPAANESVTVDYKKIS